MPNPDSSTKKTSIPSSDISTKYGYAKITLLGHTRIVKLTALQDSDGDGVPDQLDLEPNTPRGAEVDTHGRALDTDGDGVPDYRDEEKLTQQSCFPVDSNGVGVCSEPDCYRILWDIINYAWARKNFVDSILYLKPLFPSKSESLNLIKEETSGLDSAVKRILVKVVSRL